MAEQKTTKVNTNNSLIKAVKDAAGKVKSEAASKLVQKIEKQGLAKLSKEEVSELEQILEQSEDVQPEAKNLVKALNQAATNGVQAVEVIAEQTALSDFQQGLQSGVGTKQAVNKATQKAYQQAVEAGADEAEAKEAALKARESILEQVVDTAGLEEVNDIRASQVDFGAAFSTEPQQDNLLGGQAQQAGQGGSEASEGADAAQASAASESDAGPGNEAEATPAQAQSSEGVDSPSQATEAPAASSAPDGSAGSAPAPAAGSPSSSAGESSAGAASQPDSQSNQPSLNTQGSEAGSTALGAATNASNAAGVGGSAPGSAIGGGSGLGGAADSGFGGGGDDLLSVSNPNELISPVGDTGGGFGDNAAEQTLGGNEADALNSVTLGATGSANDPGNSTVSFEAGTRVITQSLGGGTTGVTNSNLVGSFVAQEVGLDGALGTQENELGQLQTQQEAGDLTQASGGVGEGEVPVDIVDGTQVVAEQTEAAEVVFVEVPPTSVEVGEIEIKEDPTGEFAIFTFEIKKGFVGNPSRIFWSVEGDLPPEILDSLPQDAVNMSPTELTRVVEIKIPANLMSFDEEFTINVSPGDPQTFLGGEPEKTIRAFETDAQVTITAQQGVVRESEEGSETVFDFLVTRSRIGGETTLDWSLDDVEGNNLTVEDFVGDAIPSGVLTLGRGITQETIRIVVQGDRDVEPDKLLKVNLSNPGNFIEVIQSSAESTIFNDDTDWSLVLTSDQTQEEGEAGQTDYTFEVRREGFVTESATIDFRVTGIGENPIQAEDFVGGVLPSGTLTFEANETVKTVTIPLVSDRVVEPTEQFRLEVLNIQASGGQDIVLASHDLTVNNDDTDWSLVLLSDSTQREGESGQTDFVFEVRRNGFVSEDATIDFALTGFGENPIQPEDIVGGVFPTGTLTFAANETVKTITVPVVSDRVVEPTEQFKLEISNITSRGGQDIVLASHELTVFNEDTDWSLVLTSEGTQDEGHVGETQFTFEVRREGFTGEQATIDFAVTGLGDNPIEAADIVGGVLPSGTLTFEANETVKTITVPIVVDSQIESTEKFQLEIRNVQASGGQDIVLASHELTVVNDDATLALSTTNPQLEEGDEGITNFTFVIDRVGDLRYEGTVEYQVTGVNGLDAVDFQNDTLPSGTITLPADQAQVTFTVPVSADITIENPEQFTVTLSNPSNGFTVIDATESATIIADDIHFNLTGPENNTQLEVDTGANNSFTYTITRSGDLREAKTVQWTAVGSGDNPVSNEELSALNGSVTFETGETVKQVTIDVAGDLIGDPGEKFTFSIQAPNESNVYTGNTSVESSIIDNEAVLHIAANQTAVLEGDAGTVSTHTFTVTRSDYLEIEAAADYRVQNLNGLSPDDFVGGVLPTGRVTFATGETTKTITIQVQGDKSIEHDEPFTVELHNPSTNVDIQGSTATSTISNDDVSFRIDALSNGVVESRSDTTRVIQWEITRNGSDAAGEVSWALKAGNFDLADVGGTLPTGTASFAAGETKKIISVTLQGDELIEGDKTYTLELSNPGVNSAIDVSAKEASNLVRNDDIGYNILPVKATEFEGNVGDSNTLTYKVVRSHNVEQAGSVKYVLEFSGANSADATDFGNGQSTNMPTGTVEFAAGETEKIVTINLAGDHIPGIDETFKIRLFDPSNNGRILIDSQDGTIQNDDSLIQFTAAQTSLSEGNDSVNKFTLSFTRTGNLQKAASVDYQISGAGESLTNGADFNSAQFPSGKVSFAAGESTKTVEIELKNDSTYEGTEFFKINFSNPSAAEVLGDGTVFSINPDDSVVSIAAQNAILAEGGTTGKAHKFVVSRFGDTSSEITLTYTVKAANNSSADAADFGGTFPSGTITLAANEASKVLEITPSADFALEENENYIVEITSTQAGVSILNSQASGVIMNDETGLTLANVSLKAAEGDAGTKNFEFKVTRSGSVSGTGTVQWELVPGETNPVDANDFAGAVLPSGTISFDQGELTKTLAISVAGDQINEASEDFKIVLKNPSTGSVLLTSEVVGVIVNDDVKISIAADQASKLEGQTGNTAFTFTVTREGDLTGTDSVNYAVTGNGTNQATTTDFAGNALPSGTVSFAAGESTKTITVNVAADSTKESDEGFKVTLSNPSTGVELGTTEATMTISDDDDSLALSAQTDTTTETDATGATLVYVVTRTGPTNTVTTVDYAVTGNGSNPVDGADFIGGSLPSGTLTFNQGETSKNITLNLTGDNNVEQNEGLKLTLSNPSTGTSLGTSQLTGTVNNDDSGLSVAATTTDIAEGSGTNSTHVFTITRSGKLDTSNTVDWSIEHAGTDNADFVATTGQVTFAPGETTKTVNLGIVGDTTVESNEDFTFKVNAGTANDQLIQGSVANNTIVSDDAGLAIAAVAATKAEGKSGDTTQLQFTVTRSGNTASTATANWALSGDVNAADFGGTLPSGTVSFDAGQTSKTITLNLKGDNVLESNEAVTVTLSSPNSGTYITTPAATTTVTNDDGKVVLTNPTTTTVEGNTGTKDLTYTITRSGDTSKAVDAFFKVVGNGDNPARLDDFVADQDGTGENSGLPSGKVSFAADQTTGTFTIKVKGDTTVELDENFQIEFFKGADNLDITASATVVSITNDDTGLSLSAVDATKAEGNSGTTAVTFEVVRAGDVSNSVSFEYAVGGDVAGSDIVGGNLPSGTITFAANETKKVITVNVQGDTTVESNENLTVTISNAKVVGTNAPVTITTNTATTAIQNEDQSFAVASQASLTEGDGGQQAFDYTITRSGDTSGSATVNYAVTSDNGGNNSDVDGSLPSGTLTFAAGETSKTVTVTVLGDTANENNENLTLTLSGQSAGTLATASSTTVITNDDTSVSIAADAASKVEGQTGNTAFTFTVTRSGVTTGTSSVDYAVAGNGSLNAADFGGTLPSGTVNFNAGETSKTITINVSGDSSFESSEAFTVTLSNPTDTVIDTSTASSTITSDDDKVAVSANTSSTFEGNSGTKDVTFTVTRSESTETTSTVDYAITGMNAADFADGTNLTGTVTFDPGQTTKTLTFAVKGDTDVENDETMTLTLSNASSGTQILTASANTEIKNEDASVSISADSASNAEGRASDGTHTFTVTRLGYLNQSSTVQYKVSGTTANPADATDFTTSDGLGNNSGLPSGSLTFSSGQTSKTITINSNNDNTLEQNEGFKVDLSNPSTGTVLGTSSANGLINNDDAEFNFSSTTTQSKAEGDSGSVGYTFTVNRTGDTAQTSTVNVNLSSVSGFTTSSIDSSHDFFNMVLDGSTTTNTSGTLTFDSGETSKTVVVNVRGDNSTESDDTFKLSLSGASTGSSVGTANEVQGVVENDDTAVSIANLSLAEGQSGTTAFTFTATRTGKVDIVSSFNYAVSSHDPVGIQDDGSASSDFVGGAFPNGTVTFQAGETTKQFTINVQGDTTVEDDEWFKITTSNLNNVSEAISNALGEIKRDEGQFDITDDPVVGDGNLSTVSNTFFEGDSNNHVTKWFAVKREIATSGTASVDWKLGGSSQTNEDVTVVDSDGSDFVAGQDSLGTNNGKPSGTLNFSDGQEYAYFSIQVKADDVGEDHQGFRINLSNASAGTDIDDSQSNLIVIGNDDPLFKLSDLSDSTWEEVGDSGTTPYTFTVTRSGDTAGTATVDWLLVLNGSETTNESNATTGTWYEAEASDFAITSGTINWADGESSKTITVQLNNDALTETYEEDFKVKIQNAVKGTSDEVGISEITSNFEQNAKILDDDNDPEITISADAATVIEGNSGDTTQVTFTLTRTDDGSEDGGVNYPSVVRYDLSGTTNTTSETGTADLSNSNSGYVTFNAGETTKTLTINVAEDNFVESDESLTVTISNTRSSGVGTGTAKVSSTNNSATTSLVNDDIGILITDEKTYQEGDSGSNQEVTVTVSRTGLKSGDVTFDWAVDTSHSAAANDITGTTSGTLTMPDGQAIKTFTLPFTIVGDDTKETDDELFQIDFSNLSAPAGKSVGFNASGASAGSSTDSTNIYIGDDDVPFNVAVSGSATKSEEDPGTSQSFSFNITRETGGDTDSSNIQWRIVGNGANPADSSDFSNSDSLGDNSGLPSGTAHFSNNDFSETVTINLSEDYNVEENEGFKIVISNPSSGNLGSTTEATATINNDDTAITIADASITEGNSGTTNLVFTITRSGLLTGTAGGDWAVLNTTTSTSDFVGATTGTFSFSAGQSTKTVTIGIAGDTDIESNETFQLKLTNVNGVSQTSNSQNDFTAIGTINNDEAEFTISATDASKSEGTGATFTITRNKDTVQDQTVTYTVSGTESNTADFGGSFPSANVTFTQGELSKVITITPNADNSAEENESYTVTITNPNSTTGVTISATDNATGTILNDDAGLTLGVANTTISEGDTNNNFNFTVTRSGNTSGTASVQWKVSSQTAGLDTGDFVAGQDALGNNGGLPSGTINWADGETTKTIPIQIVGDFVFEQDETFRIDLSNATNADLLVSQKDITLSKEDSLLALTTTTSSKAEGDSGTTDFTFTVTRTGDLTNAATVQYAVTGSDVNAADFQGSSLPSGTLTLAANEATTTLTIKVTGDELPEDNEDFTVTLSNASSTVGITDATETVTITTEDTNFDVSGPTANNLVEKDKDETTDFEFTITRTGDKTASQSVDWTVAGTGTHALGAEEIENASGSVTFSAGETTKTVTVKIKGDTAGENNETFRFSITPPNGAGSTTSHVDATIVEDEAVYGILAGQTSVQEGATGSLTDHTFTITRSGQTNFQSTVDYLVSAGNGITAEDFENDTLPTGTLTFATGETSKTVTVKVKGDTTFENDEIFSFKLQNPSIGSAIQTGKVNSTIQNDEIQWVAAVNGDASKAEGDSGFTTFQATVTRSGKTDASATIDYAVAGNGTNQAVAADFKDGTFPSGTLTFNAGETSKTITVQVVTDSIKEENDGFRLTVSNAQGDGTHSIQTPNADFTINNDDDVMSISTAQNSVVEGDTGTDKDFTFTVTRDGSTDGNSSVQWRIANSSATDNADFDQTSGTVNFANGESSKNVTIKVKGDTDVEANEAFTVELHTPGTGSTISSTNGSASSQITNQDIDLTPSSTSLAVNEGDSTGGAFSFVVTRTGDISGATTVDYKVANGSTATDDFATGQDALGTNNGLPSGTVSFAAGESAKTVTVTFNPDGVVEQNETYSVTLSNPSGNAQINSGTLNATITNDDDTLAISAVNASKAEGEAGDVTNYEFKVDRGSSSIGEATVKWTVTGSSDHPLDVSRLVAATGTLTFADGESSKILNIQLNGDEVGTYDQGFTVTLSEPSLGSTIQTATAVGSVVNDDPVLTVATANPTIVEGDTGGFITYTITRSGDTTGTSSVKFNVNGTGDNAASESDFGGEFPAGNITFAPGETTKTIAIPINLDSSGEFDEAFNFTLSGAAGADVIGDPAKVTLVNDDTALAIQSTAVDKLEGNTNTTEFQFTVTRTGPLTGTSTVDWNLVGDGTFQVSADDFVNNTIPSGSLTFAPNETTKTITFQAKTDSIPGSDEGFKVKLSNAAGADLINAESTGKILNDDSEVFVSIDSATQNEGNAGTVDYVFKVARTGYLNAAASVDWQVQGYGENQANAQDFLNNAFAQGTVQFASGESEKLVTVKVNGDAIGENTEQFKMVLSNSSNNATIKESGSWASATITNDDQGIFFSGEDQRQDEGTSENNAFTFQLHRYGNSSDALDVNWAVQGTGDKPADADDFVSTSGTLSFAAGELTKQLTIYSKADNAVENDETFKVVVSKDGVNFPVSEVEGTLVDDDTGIRVQAVTDTVQEDSGTVSFEISRTGPTNAALDVNYAVAGSGKSPTEAADLTTQVAHNGTVSFAAGESTKTVTLHINDDSLDELSEVIEMKVSNTAGVRVLQESATVTLQDNDTAGTGDDVIYGDGDAQTLSGGDGNDWISGEGGSDTLIGGAGNDTFYFNSPNEGVDYITDFVKGQDKIMYNAGAFQTLQIQAVANQTELSDIQAAINGLAAQGDSDLYTMDTSANQFSHEAGDNGHLDELEAAFTNGEHTGAAFIAVSDGSATQLYFDADTNAGTDGSGLVHIAEIQSVNDANDFDASTIETTING